MKDTHTEGEERKERRENVMFIGWRERERKGEGEGEGEREGERLCLKVRFVSLTLEWNTQAVYQVL